MKCIYILVLVTSLLLSGTSFSQDTIKWSNKYKLKWKDFQGTPDTTLGSAAVTSSGFSCQTLFTDTSFTVNIFAFFEKKKSWKTNDTTQNTLIHEQGHFDISEIFARKLKLQFKSLVPIRSSIQSDVNALVQKMNADKELMQDKYDEETDFGRNCIAQQNWLRFIGNELKKLPRTN